MSNATANGTVPTVDQLRERVQRERLQSRLAQATHSRQLWESLGQLNGFGMGDLLNPWGYRRDDLGGLWLPLSGAGVSARKDGRDYPFITTDSDLDQQRSLARWLAAKNDLAIGALRTVRNLTIKKGYTWEARPAKGYEEDSRALYLTKQVQSLIDDHSDVNKLPARERSSCWRASRDGEPFTRHFAQHDGTTIVRFVLPEQVRDPGNRGPHASFGIECDEGDVETPLYYHVTYDGTSYECVPAAEMCHLKRNVDEEIKRGVSDFFSAGETFDEVAKLLRGMRRGAALLSKIAWIEEFSNTTRDQMEMHQAGRRDLNFPQIDHPVTGRRVDQQTMLDGTVVRTQDNKKYQPPPLAANTANFVSVVQAALRAVGTRWGFPEYFISGDASNNAYSSILVAGSPLVSGIETDQDDFGAFFLRWRWIAIRNACAAGLIRADFAEVEALCDLHFTPPQVVVADEGKQAEVDHKDLAAGVMSLQTRRSRRGLDDEQERGNLKEEPPTRIAGRATDLDAQGNPIGSYDADQPQPSDKQQEKPGGVAAPPLAGQKTSEPPASKGERTAAADSTGGLQAILQLQISVYKNEVPRLAAIANAEVAYGFSSAEAARLFPDVTPKNVPDDEGDQGGGGQPPPQTTPAAPLGESLLSGPLREQRTLVLELLRQPRGSG